MRLDWPHHQDLHCVVSNDFSGSVSLLSLSAAFQSSFVPFFVALVDFIVVCLSMVHHE